MTMNVTVQCSCQASYQVPRERAGARFKCKRCGATLTVPRTEPEPERPVVMPSAAPAEAPARPVVMPKAAAPQPAPARPVVMPARPLAAEPPPVVKPSRSAARAERPARPEPAEAATRSRLPLVLMVAGGALLLAVGGWFAWPKSKPEGSPPAQNGAVATTAPPVEPQPPRPAFDAAKRIAEFKAEIGTGSAKTLWAFAGKLDALAKEWTGKGAPADAVAAVEQEKEVALEDLLKLDPEHAEARGMRGEVKYQNELDPFVDATYLSDSDRDLARRNKDLVTKRAGENGGWISKTMFEALVKPLVDRLGAVQVAAESMATSPFGRAARELETSTMDDLKKVLGDTAAFRAFVYKPYVIFVEENPGWSPATEAKSLFSPLKAILEAFLKEFASLDLQPLEVPVPVVYFMSEKRYQEYNEKIGNSGLKALAHYEPDKGRLVLNRGVTHEVIIHEGTHQIFDKYTKNVLKHHRQSFWFQEGIAEWFGGSNRLPGKDGSWTYETGVLLDGRLNGWAMLEKAQFTLSDLLDQTYAKRNEYIAMGGAGETKIHLVYSQGWFFIYFLNHFNVGTDGMVQIGARGKYADGWNEYLKAELNGRTGKKVFMECLKLDDAALEKMNQELLAYFDFVRRKRNLGQVQEKKLVAWDKYVNKKGQKTGEKEDDLLIAPPRGESRPR